MTAPTKLTRANILAKVRASVGLHATLGNAPAIDDIVTEANEYVFDQLTGGELNARSSIRTFANQFIYDWESWEDGTEISPGRVQAVWIEYGTSSRVKLRQGITEAHRADTDLRGIPERYDTLFQDGGLVLELWPTPDQQYSVFIEHDVALRRFEEATDKPSAPQRLVLQYAIARAKAHYGKPDAEVAGKAFQTMLSREKYRAHENHRYTPSEAGSAGPQVVKTATGYTQIG